MFVEYIFVLKYVWFCLAMSFLLFMLSFLFVYQKPDSEKLSSYECGFNPFGDARNKFDVKFYLVGILFIIFDLEISFLFPWMMNLYNMPFCGVASMFFFLFMLTVGSFMSE